MIEILGLGVGWLIGKNLGSIGKALFSRDHPEPKGIFDSDEEFLDFIKLLKIERITANRDVN